jgi:hypothetical protein
MGKIQILIKIESLKAQQIILYQVLGAVGLDKMNEETIKVINSNIKDIDKQLNKLNKQLK